MSNFRTRHGTLVEVRIDEDCTVLQFLPEAEATTTQTIATEFFDELVARGDLVPAEG